MNFSNDIQQCINALNGNGLILYPTDTIWGIGCDATNEEAVNKIFALKQRAEKKSMIVLLSDFADVFTFVNNPDPQITSFISEAVRPTTAIYERGKNLARGLLNEDGSVAIRITRDEFCRALVNEFKKPLVSTSANISGEAAPAIFEDIGKKIKNGVDYIVQHRRRDFKVARPSAIIKLDEEKKIIVIRS